MATTSITEILPELGLDLLAPEQQEELLQDIGSMIFQAVVLRSLTQLSDADKENFDTILSQEPPNEEAVLAFLQTKIQDFNGLADEELDKFSTQGAELLERLRAGSTL